jgi:hypothetical protein
MMAMAINNSASELLACEIGTFAGGGGTCLTLMSMTPASAAPREIEDFCFEQLQQATRYLS